MSEANGLSRLPRPEGGAGGEMERGRKPRTVRHAAVSVAAGGGYCAFSQVMNAHEVTRVWSKRQQGAPFLSTSRTRCSSA